MLYFWLFYLFFFAVHFNRWILIFSSIDESTHLLLSWKKNQSVQLMSRFWIAKRYSSFENELIFDRRSEEIEGRV